MARAVRSFQPPVVELPDGLAQEVEAFLVDREARQCRPGTIAHYRKKLDKFQAFAREKGIESLLQLTPHLLRQYLIGLADKHTPGGVDTFYRSLRAFSYWFEEEFDLEGWRNPIRKVKAPKVPEQVLEPVSLADLGAMLDTCDTDTKLGCRDRAILLALLDTGCRAQEFLDISLGDLNAQTGACQIRSGKGAKPRTVFFSGRIREALQAYLDYRPDAHALSPLWATRHGTRLRYAGLRSIIRRRSKDAGIEASSLHSFRRAFALCCLRDDMDVYSLQRLMGHSDLSMLRRYLAQTHEDLMRAHMEHSPVESMLFVKRDPLGKGSELADAG
jgi:integrase/recombinase XerD